MKLTIYTSEELAPIIEEGTKGFANKNQWINSLLNGIATLVKRSPIAYRSFGPFWWPVKKMLQDAELLEGEEVDQALIDRVSMGATDLNLAAAFAFQEWANDNQLASNNVFPVTTEDGGSDDYTLIDEEMEAGISAR
ncbi:MAG: hypothetical protein ACXWT0_00415 [Methylobacter sp.]